MLRDWIRTISSDEFGGRKPMTPYEEKTINYMADQFRALGLKPLFGDSYFQPFKMIATTCRPVGGKFRVKGKKKTELLYEKDMMVWTARATDKVKIPAAEIVFCGFGIDAPEYNWNDFDVNMSVGMFRDISADLDEFPALRDSVLPGAPVHYPGSLGRKPQWKPLCRRGPSVPAPDPG